MTGRRKSWRDLGTAQRAAMVLGGVVQVALQVATLLDLRRRADTELNGSRRVWVLLSFVNFFGPIVYFLAGRRRTMRAPRRPGPPERPEVDECTSRSPRMPV